MPKKLSSIFSVLVISVQIQSINYIGYVYLFLLFHPCSNFIDPDFTAEGAYMTVKLHTNCNHMQYHTVHDEHDCTCMMTSRNDLLKHLYAGI